MRMAFAGGAMLALVTLPGCAISARTEPAAAAAPAQRGLAFARARCAGCHAVTANASSPNPEAPPFDDIANTPGLTAQTVAAFLNDAHNYPAAMNFSLDSAAIADLSAHFLTLRRSGYRPTR